MKVLVLTVILSIVTAAPLHLISNHGKNTSFEAAQPSIKRGPVLIDEGEVAGDWCQAKVTCLAGDWFATCSDNKICGRGGCYTCPVGDHICERFDTDGQKTGYYAKTCPLGKKCHSRGCVNAGESGDEANPRMCCGTTCAAYKCPSGYVVKNEDITDYSTDFTEDNCCKLIDAPTNDAPTDAPTDAWTDPPTDAPTSGPASVKCGGHSAPTCAECDRGNGWTWCNGDCEWWHDKQPPCRKKKPKRTDGCSGYEHALCDTRCCGDGFTCTTFSGYNSITSGVGAKLCVSNSRG